MRIYVVNLRKYAKYLFFAALTMVAVILAASALNPDAAGVFSNSRELPIYCVDSTEKKVAITFDCAWGAGDIPDILKALEKENVKATFFLVGQWADKFPDAVKAIAAGGHDVANHSYSHLRMGAIDNGKIKSEISVCGEKLAQLSGNKIDLFRPPYGDYSNSVIKHARDLGYYTIQWDVDSLDWKPGISQDEILSRVLRKVKPGSIILFHNDTPYTAKLMPTIIKNLKKNGYEIVPVSNMILRENYYIDFQGRQKKKE